MTPLPRAVPARPTLTDGPAFNVETAIGGRPPRLRRSAPIRAAVLSPALRAVRGPAAPDAPSPTVAGPTSPTTTVKATSPAAAPPAQRGVPRGADDQRRDPPARAKGESEHAFAPGNSPGRGEAAARAHLIGEAAPTLCHAGMGPAAPLRLASDLSGDRSADRAVEAFQLGYTLSRPAPTSTSSTDFAPTAASSPVAACAAAGRSARARWPRLAKTPATATVVRAARLMVTRSMPPAATPPICCRDPTVARPFCFRLLALGRRLLRMLRHDGALACDGRRRGHCVHARTSCRALVAATKRLASADQRQQPLAVRRASRTSPSNWPKSRPIPLLTLAAHPPSAAREVSRQALKLPDGITLDALALNPPPALPDRTAAPR